MITMIANFYWTLLMAQAFCCTIAILSDGVFTLFLALSQSEFSGLHHMADFISKGRTPPLSENHISRIFCFCFLFNKLRTPYVQQI